MEFTMMNLDAWVRSRWVFRSTSVDRVETMYPEAQFYASLNWERQAPPLSHMVRATKEYVLRSIDRMVYKELRSLPPKS
ncbi:hypothetical protein EMCG_03195 [[Emmonsia] crescens]|uniref:Uncharacterized protein n=1 Tax=[Emmonsia] crescens TaxID=73230 RepID=A0A0G2HXA2_9EURO|nr:hypothetical protein EMCG_03195 [Emmonsia crescens UAMH 3008]